MAVIALVGNKGDTGKTTLAVNLATMLAKEEATVIFDTDPQGLALQWQAIAGRDRAPKVIDAASNLEEVFAQTGDRYGHVVIDCPPSVHAPQTHAALTISDVALVPVQPSPLDLWATVHIEQAIEKAQQFNPKLRAILVINQLEPRAKLSRLMRQALAELLLCRQPIRPFTGALPIAQARWTWGGEGQRPQLRSCWKTFSINYLGKSLLLKNLISYWFSRGCFNHSLALGDIALIAKGFSNSF